MNKINIFFIAIFLTLSTYIYSQSDEDTIINMTQMYQDALKNDNLSSVVDFIHTKSLIKIKEEMLTRLANSPRYEDLPPLDSLKEMNTRDFFITVSKLLNIVRSMMREGNGDFRSKIIGALLKGERGYVVFESEITMYDKSSEVTDVMLFEKENNNWKILK